jgi:hypothetical protein
MAFRDFVQDEIFEHRKRVRNLTEPRDKPA